jgi:hypothetical protein
MKEKREKKRVRVWKEEWRVERSVEKREER